MPVFDGGKTTIDILRHAECEGGSIFRGATDVPLSEGGWARLRRVTVPLSGWDAIVTSPLQRCRCFAEELAVARGLPLTVDERFREMHFGDWEGESVADIWSTQFAAAMACYFDPANHSPPNAEPLSAVRERVAAGWADLVAAHQGGHVLLVTHGGVMRNLLAHLLDMPAAASNRFGMPYGCRTQIEVLQHGDSSMPQLMGHNLDQA